MAVERRGGPAVSTVQGCWVHYVHLGQCNSVKVGSNFVQEKKSAANAPEQEEKVRQLLPETSSPNIFGTANTARSQIYYVTPRNISPWSSKATSIAHVCGLKTQVQRIERGRAIMVEFSEPFQGGNDIPFRDALYEDDREY